MKNLILIALIATVAVSCTNKVKLCKTYHTKVKYTNLNKI